jgi:hypothetical protein
MHDDSTTELDLEAQYREMASDETQEREAEEWIEALIGDAFPEE